MHYLNFHQVIKMNQKLYSIKPVVESLTFRKKYDDKQKIKWMNIQHMKFNKSLQGNL